MKNIMFLNSAALLKPSFNYLKNIFITNFMLPIFFFYLGFLSRTFTNHRTAGEGGGHFLSPHYHFHPLHRHLDVRHFDLDIRHVTNLDIYC